MYGTAARRRVKPGAAGDVQPLPRLMAQYLYRTDDDRNELYLAVVFASREASRANAESPEQHARHARLLQSLAGLHERDCPGGQLGQAEGVHL
jgi:hypothetical protein